MTNENIERLIDALNASEMGHLIFLTSLTKIVDIAKVWLQEPQGITSRESSYPFFFIKNLDGIYVAAVLDMYNDLHVFVKELHRKQGHLTKAMKSTILPKLFQDGREVQAITFRTPEMADYCTKYWGFTVISDTSAELDLSIFKNNPKINRSDKELTQNDFTIIKDRIKNAKVYLKMIKDQLEIAYGQCKELSVEEMIYELNGMDDEILDLVEIRQGNLRQVL